MAMTKRLWSVNALATELGRDRRTVAKALRNVPPDGTLNGHAAWHLDTALDALQPGRSTDTAGADFGAMLVGRVKNWREIPRRYDESWLFGVDRTAWMFGVEADVVLTWLRAGMPFEKEGDWETGEGFLMRPCWIIDWHVLVYAYAKLTGQEKLIRTLQLPA